MFTGRYNSINLGRHTKTDIDNAIAPQTSRRKFTRWRYQKESFRVLLNILKDNISKERVYFRGKTLFHKVHWLFKNALFLQLFKKLRKVPRAPVGDPTPETLTSMLFA